MSRAVKLTQFDGDDAFVNPERVASVRAGEEGYAEVWFSGSVDAVDDCVLVVQGSAEEVARRVFDEVRT